MKKNYPLFICIICFLILNILLIISNINSQSNQDNYFRLHIVANSNSVNDQIIKLNVVKKVNNYLNSLCNSNAQLNNKNDTKTLIINNIDSILDVANSELNRQNTAYTCYANIGKISYDEKKSDLINMDKGTYDSIQIILGDGKGENFWSLIFPYSYNPNYDITDNNTILPYNEIKLESKILKTLKKVVKTLNS